MASDTKKHTPKLAPHLRNVGPEGRLRELELQTESISVGRIVRALVEIPPQVVVKAAANPGDTGIVEAVDVDAGTLTVHFGLSNCRVTLPLSDYEGAAPGPTKARRVVPERLSEDRRRLIANEESWEATLAANRGSAAK